MLVAFVLQFVRLVALATADDRGPARRGVLAALVASVRGVPGGDRRRAAAAAPVADRARALVAVELFWGFGMATFETLMPVRLTEVRRQRRPGRRRCSARPASAAWLASAVGAALIPLLARRIGAPWTGCAAADRSRARPWSAWALFAGPVGVIAAYLLCYTVHGAANPVHSGLLHRQVDGPYRASLISLNSMVSQPAGALGLVVLTAIAARQSVSAAMLVGAVVLAAAAPLYLVARRPRPPTIVSRAL